MGEPVGFEGADFLYTGGEGIRDLPVYRDETQVISCWRLTEAEMLTIAETGVVWLRVMGHTLPPMEVSGTPMLYIGDKASVAEPIIPNVYMRKQS
jgi:hypothetical protein